ncbi:hypothetical protein LCGC14_0768060 [marine sediment metagenome]|uniref:Uncharacterized protein n=1 Tax=marine sediment metagenome TaxID=412755 RepID=A0A0F9PZ95_9ZZZZ
MTQETETPTMDLNIVSCQTCDALFVESERRQTCPSCGGEPVGPYFRFVLDADGLHRKDGAAPAAAQPTPAEEPAEELEPLPIVDDRQPEELAGGLGDQSPAVMFPLTAMSYLQGGEGTEGDLRGLLADLGAEPEAAAAAVGRMVAVRDLLRDLAAAGVEAEVEVGVEVTPAEATEPVPEPAEGEPPPAPEPPPAGEGQESEPSEST